MLIFHKKIVISVILYFKIYMLLMLTIHGRSRDIRSELKLLENSFQIHIIFFLDLKLFISIVFDFSWDHCNTQEKLETMVMQKFGGY